METVYLGEEGDQMRLIRKAKLAVWNRSNRAGRYVVAEDNIVGRENNVSTAQA
jgi:hypothetical protein